MGAEPPVGGMGVEAPHELGYFVTRSLPNINFLSKIGAKFNNLVIL